MPPYRFRNFRLDPATRELHRDDRLLALPGSAFDCLLYLIEHRDRAIGRDELIAAVWGRVDVTDNLLAQTVLRIRRTLGDEGSNGAIRTVARFGYRWVEPLLDGDVPVDAAADGETAAGDETVRDDTPRQSEHAVRPVSSASARRRSPATRIAFAAALLLVVAAVAWWTLARDVATTPPDRADAPVPMAVLPAELADAAGWDWLRLGLMDVIGNRLRAGGLTVSPSERTLALLADGGALPPALRAAPRVTPSARFVRDRWRVRLHIERDDAPALDIDAEAADVLEAARSAADLLLVRLGRAPPASGPPRPLALEALLQQTRTALLSDQFDLARQLIAQAPPDVRDSAEIGLRLAQIDQGLGDDRAAETRLLALLDRVPAGSDDALRGRILLALGSSRFRGGALDDARSSFDDAIAALATTADAAARAGAYGSRAAIASMREDYAAAEADLGRARVEMQAAGDLLGLAQIDTSLGLTHVRSGRPALGVPLLRDAQARIVALGAREELAYVRSVLAGAELQLLEVRAARATSDSAWPPELHTANVRLRWRLTLARVFVLMAQGEFTAAETLLARIAADASPEADADVRHAAAALAGVLLAERGRHEEAVVALDRALVSALQQTQPDVALLAWCWRLRSQRALGRNAPARAETDALVAWVAAHPSPWRRLHAALARAEQSLAEGDAAAARERFAGAFADARALGVPDDIAAVALPYVRALLDGGDIDGAASVVGLVAGWAHEDARVAWAQAMLYRAQGRIDAWQQASAQALRLSSERPAPAPRLE